MLQLFDPPSTLMHKKSLGQYMTPENIANFMASLFPKIPAYFHLLDAGAGKGILTHAFLKASPYTQGEVSMFEYDRFMVQLLERNTRQYIQEFPVVPHIYHTDFIEYATKLILDKQRPYTHAILNPPYKKINSNSVHRSLLRAAGIETVNLYTAFVALSLALLQPHGILTAIIPRSFCNGPYYKQFRQYILQKSAIRRIHLFKSRTEAFKNDNVLQENIILVLERDAKQNFIDISISMNSKLDEYSEKQYNFNDIILPHDDNLFIQIPDNNEDIQIIKGASHSLSSLDINVSTGPIVDFRIKKYLRNIPSSEDIPLLYPGHFNGNTKWPRTNFKKPNAVEFCPETIKWLYPSGHYVVVRRLSSKEEKRRIIAYHVKPDDFPGRPYFGFENHLNVFHRYKHGLSEDLAHGLTLYLNSSYIDTLFRRFNGHTQVNATDLRALPYPSIESLIEFGKWSDEQTDMTHEKFYSFFKDAFA